MIKPRHVLFLVACFGTTISLTFSSLSSGQSGARPLITTIASASYVPDQVLVKFKRGMTSQARAQLLSTFGDKQLRAPIGSSGYTLVKLPPGRTMASALATYRAMTDIESVQPNYRYKALAAPNDANYPLLWGLNNDGQPVNAAAGTPGADMDMEQTWDHITDCSSVVVAVLDSGVNYTHLDLANNMWDSPDPALPKQGWDFIDNDEDPMPADADGHGTHVAATIGAVGDNVVGITGICWQARIMAVRVLSANGGDTVSVISGLNFAVENGATVVNMSLGGPGFDQAFQDEIFNARNNGVVVVAAAGNDGTDNNTAPVYPCSFPQDNVICVAALDQHYNRPSFSNFGSTSVDVGAPGSNIYSAWPGAITMENLTSWTHTGGWGEVICDFGIGFTNMLVNPSTWCSGPPFPTYATGANEIAYKNFDLSGALGALASFFVFLDTEPNQDFLGVAKSADGGDPFATNPGSILEASGSTNGFAVQAGVSLGDCLTVDCTFGFRLRSNSVTTVGASGEDIEFGIGIFDFEIATADQDSNAYRFAAGTSMAAPHVAGLAAMIWAYNPDYTYADVVNSVKLGGESVPALAGITTAGRAVNGMGSLRYINPPTNVSAAVLQ